MTTPPEVPPGPQGPASPVHELFPYLCVRGGAAAIDFYSRVFGARETARLSTPDGRVMHAELAFGPVTVMLSDEHPDFGILSPLAFGGTGLTLHLHVDDVDAIARAAAPAGAVILSGPADHGHGERQCRLRDPFGHEWLLGHQIESLSWDEIQRRFEAGE